MQWLNNGLYNGANTCKNNIKMGKNNSGEEFRRMRMKIGKTQAEFSKLLGIDIGTYSKWERGIHPPSAIALTALKLLNILVEKYGHEF